MRRPPGMPNSWTWLVRAYPACSAAWGLAAALRWSSTACAASCRAPISASRWLASRPRMRASSNVSLTGACAHAAGAVRNITTENNAKHLMRTSSCRLAPGDASDEHVFERCGYTPHTFRLHSCAQQLRRQPFRRAVRRPRLEACVRALAEQLHVHDVRKLFEHLHGAIAI